MTPSPKLLFITPTLGVSKYLDRAVSSIRRQILPITHVISAPVSQLTELRRRFPESTVVADDGRQGGIYGALNRGLAEAPAGWEWFSYLNDDDLLLPAFSESVIEHLSRKNPEPVVYGDVQIIDATDQPIARITVEKNPRWIPALLKQGISPLMQQGMLFRRDVVAELRGFDTRYRLCADLDFWLRAYASSNAFRYHPATVAQFRVHEGQLSSNTQLTDAEQSAIVAKHLRLPISLATRVLARIRYRIANAPRYLERIRRRGVKRSYALLNSAPAS